MVSEDFESRVIETGSSNSPRSDRSDATRATELIVLDDEIHDNQKVVEEKNEQDDVVLLIPIRFRCQKIHALVCFGESAGGGASCTLRRFQKKSKNVMGIYRREIDFKEQAFETGSYSRRKTTTRLPIVDEEYEYSRSERPG